MAANEDMAEGGAARSQVTGLLRVISASGIGVLLVEHDMQLVMSTAQQVVVLDAGSKIASGTPIEVGANPQVIEAYLGVLQDA